MCIRKGGAGHERVNVGVANITWPPEDRERERKWWLDQDQVSAKLDMRHTVMGNCALDGQGYAH